MKREIVTITCDLNPLDGEATTHVLALDGRNVEIDLCGECLDPLYGYLDGGRPQGKPRPGSMPARRRAAAIRAWAVSQGLAAAGSRGRLPAAVIAAYDAREAGAR